MQVRIEKIITGGLGLARRADGMVVLTRFVLPGETVAVRETAQHRGYVEADLVQVLMPSAERITPVCPHFTVCGGCDFQHIDAGAQFRHKKEICAEALLRAGLHVGAEVLEPVLPSPRSFNYRHRIRLKLTAAGELGFFQHRSNLIVAIDQCPVATDRLNTALRQLQASALPREAAAVVREIVLLHSPADDRIHALLLPEPGTTVNAKAIVACAGELPAIQALWCKTKSGLELLAGNDPAPLLRQDFPPEICGRPFTLRWPPGSFSQVNAEQNQRLIRLVLQLAGRVAGQHVLDLFCGMGNFAVPLALAGARVMGVERSRDSVAGARNNATVADCQDIEFIAADVAKALNTPVLTRNRFDQIVLDPPRQGLGRDSLLLAELGAPRIIYISCDPATLMRDLALLTARGYRLARITPVDMFPQTHHIETVALLEKN